MFSYDPALLTAVEAVPTSVSGVLSIMQTIDQTCIDGDGLKWFNWLYLRVTQAVKTRIDSANFSNPSWLAELDGHFAHLYFSALKSALIGQPAPDCWQTLFRSRRQAPVARIQFALAGINAHINHDLAQAIVTTCQLTGTVPAHNSALYTDYTALNTTLDAQINLAKQTLLVRLLGEPLPPVSHLENLIAAWSVCAARETAWQNAELLWHLQDAPPLSANFMNTLDGLTTLANNALLVPVP